MKLSVQASQQSLRAGSHPVRHRTRGRRCEVVALLGRNGAGKSTTFRSIVGLVEQRTGRIVFEARMFRISRAMRSCRGGLGYVPEERRIFHGPHGR